MLEKEHNNVITWPKKPKSEPSSDNRLKPASSIHKKLKTVAFEVVSRRGNGLPTESVQIMRLGDKPLEGQAGEKLLLFEGKASPEPLSPFPTLEEAAEQFAATSIKVVQSADQLLGQLLDSRDRLLKTMREGNERIEGRTECIKKSNNELAARLAALDVRTTSQ